jgi:hypothetical protein
MDRFAMLLESFPAFLCLVRNSDMLISVLTDIPPFHVSSYDVTKHAPGLRAHHVGAIGLTRTPRFAIRNAISCSRGCASYTSVVAGPDQKISVIEDNDQQHNRNGNRNEYEDEK